MGPADQRTALQELTARGLIAAAPAPRPLGTGNADRQDVRASWIVGLPDGRTARLLLGRDLRTQSSRHAAFRRDCPRLISAPCFYEQLPHGEALAEEFLPACRLSDDTRTPHLLAETVQRALSTILHELALTERASTESDRAAEWNAWVARLAGLPIFTPSDAKLLRDRILPRLYLELTAGTPPRTRWSNGDFHADNLLVDPDGKAWLVDLEFARRTHFYREDAVRFHVFSSLARRHPDWFNVMPDPGPSWHLYFWLRQLELEATVNSRAYLERTAPRRLAVVRRLAEFTLDVSLDGWSVPTLPVHFHVEENGMSEAGAAIAGWCHVPSAPALRSIVALSPAGILAEATLSGRPDVQAHFGGEPEALRSGFRLSLPPAPEQTPLWLAAAAVDGTLLPFHTLQRLVPGVGTGAPRTSAVERLHRFPPSEHPLISVIMPVYNPPVSFLERAIGSVIGQSYPHWELCIVDDASSHPAVHERLRQLAAGEPRIKLHFHSANWGISGASNTGLRAAQGSHAAFLDHDDELSPDALCEVAAVLLEAPDTDVIYTDQDKCDEQGVRFTPFRKPDWSPVYFLGVMYVGHLLVARVDLLRRRGGCDPTYDRIQDYELMLRLSEHTRRIAHIPRILYHWRALPGSIARSSQAKGSVDELQVAAVQAHLARMGHRAKAVSHSRLPHRVQLMPAGRMDDRLVSILPVDGDPGNVAAITTHRSYELVNDIAGARGEYVLLLRSRLEIITPDWLQILLTHLDLPGVGAVGPLIMDANGLVEYAGDALLTGLAPDADGPGGSLACSREVHDLPPACFMTRRSLLLENPSGEADAGLISAKLRQRNLARLYVANVTLRRLAR